MRTIRTIAVIASLFIIFIPTSVLAQAIVKPRVKSYDGSMLIPVASTLMGSDTHAHINRGSVSAYDIIAPYGSPVYSPCNNGYVRLASTNNAGGYGHYMYIRCPNGYTILVAHLNRMRVSSGDTVGLGTVVGIVSNTGMTSFPHVHIEIRNEGYGRIKIEDIFPHDAFSYCHVCQQNGAIWAWNQENIQAAKSVPFTAIGFTWLRITPLLLFGLSLFLPKRYYLDTIFGGVVMGFNIFLVVLITALISMGISPALLVPTFPNLEVTSFTNDNTFNTIHSFTQKWEGTSPKCVYDPVKTNLGVTQGTYDTYKVSRGLPRGDVCTDLTGAELANIYHDMFYVKSGADKLDWPLSLAHYDFYVNSPANAVKTLNQCTNGNVMERFQCYNSVRRAKYRGMKLYGLYGKAWENRVNDLERFVSR